MQRLKNLKKEILNLKSLFAWDVDYIKHFVEAYTLFLTYKETVGILDPYS